MGIAPIGGISVSPQIYNVNRVSANSMNKINPISDDLTSAKTDFSDLADSATQNMNPLEQGQTNDFDGIAQMGMAMGLSKAAMFFG